MKNNKMLETLKPLLLEMFCNKNELLKIFKNDNVVVEELNKVLEKHGYIKIIDNEVCIKNDNSGYVFFYKN